VGSRALIMAAAVVVVSLLQVTFDFFFIGFVADNLDKSWQDLARDLLRGYEATFNYILVFGVNVTLFQLALSRRKEVRQERQLTDARSAAHTAQLAALRYQLNPHFLFNALNSISALIVTKRNDDAENMTGKLSSFLRSSLACDPAELVPLESELALIEEYLDIEAVRFGERLNVEIDCDAAAGVSLVPGFLVQPLVENAIKHGVSPSRAPVTISIKAYVDDTDLHISVENDKVEGGGTAPRFERPGVGLINVEQRLEAVYGKKAKLTAAPHDGRYCATICIPRIEGLH
jgi:LytS/YehU family sensor histidine kinase